MLLWRHGLNQFSNVSRRLDEKFCNGIQQCGMVFYPTTLGKNAENFGYLQDVRNMIGNEGRLSIFAKC